MNANQPLHIHYVSKMILANPLIPFVEADTSLAKMRIIAEGILEGAGDTAIVQQAAPVLGIEGLVQNREDGRVEIFCEDPKDRIEKSLTRFLKEYTKKKASKHTNVGGP